MKKNFMKFMTQWGNEQTVFFVKNTYVNNGRLCIHCWCEDEEYGGYEPYCDVTVNLPSYLPKGNYAYLDVNNGDPNLFAAMVERGYMEYVEGMFAYFGWNSYPMVKFSDEFLETLKEE